MIVHAFAKINLYLDVLGKRPDGYTDIETIFQTVSLHDTLRFDTRPSGLTLECSDKKLDSGPTNLVIRAAEVLLRHTGSTEGAAIRLEKHIPIAAGLAGGSVDGAASLTALNALWSLGLDDESLFMCALELGSDVPYCLQGGSMAGTGRGERLTALPPLPESWFVLVSPPVEISAASVYGHPALTRNTQSPVEGMTPAFRDALQALAEGKLADLMFNRMESAIAAIHPEVASVKDRLREAGCSAAIVSGSGPTVLGLCAGREQAERIAKSFGRPRATAVHTVPKSLVFNPRP